MPWSAPWECHCPCCLPSQAGEIKADRAAGCTQPSLAAALVELGFPENETLSIADESTNQSSPMIFSPLNSWAIWRLLALLDLCLHRELLSIWQVCLTEKKLVAWIFYSCCFGSLLVLTPLPSSDEMPSVNTTISRQRGISHHGGWTVVFPLLADCLTAFFLLPPSLSVPKSLSFLHYPYERINIPSPILSKLRGVIAY